jgi:hypothetical protein
MLSGIDAQVIALRTMCAHSPTVCSLRDRTAMATRIRSTRDRAEVERVRMVSLDLLNAAALERVKDWDSISTWHNEKFRHEPTGAEWVIYLPDQAWPGEVKVLNEAGYVELP